MNPGPQPNTRTRDDLPMLLCKTTLYYNSFFHPAFYLRTCVLLQWTKELTNYAYSVEPSTPTYLNKTWLTPPSVSA